MKELGMELAGPRGPEHSKSSFNLPNPDVPQQSTAGDPPTKLAVSTDCTAFWEPPPGRNNLSFSKALPRKIQVASAEDGVQHEEFPLEMIQHAFFSPGFSE